MVVATEWREGLFKHRLDIGLPIGDCISCESYDIWALSYEKFKRSLGQSDCLAVTNVWISYQANPITVETIRPVR